MRFFNTAGPMKCDIHYCVPPLERLDLGELLSLIDGQKYFILHAPRQTGKTSCLLALMAHLNEGGRYRALYANLEPAQADREDVARGMTTAVQVVALAAKDLLGDRSAKPLADSVLASAAPAVALEAFLTEWCRASARPVVLMLDEVDSLVGDTLISLLRQLRAGYAKRPQLFPQSIILCGVRDVRDYRIHSSAEKSVITGGSAFNVKAKSLRLGDFSRAEVEQLYAEHTQATGQAFTPEAMELVWELTCGQPWLVNALADEACFEMPAGKDRSRPVTAELLAQAKENLIRRRETHLDQLADKLREERVRRVIEPLLVGELEPEKLHPDDISYVRDLGLIRTNGNVAIANGIYQEVIPRELTYDTQVMLVQEAAWYTGPDGRLDMRKLLAAFQEFFRQHSAHWVERFDYKEAGPQLLLQAFLQRVINGGGQIHREYGLGRRRTDLLVEWPLPEGGAQRVVIEMKLLYDSLERTVADGLEQTADYMDSSGAQEGHLLIFDRRPARQWEEKIFLRDEHHRGRAITVWGM